jgi:putative tryptophan/tyrosine transport system substrate-binding protein
MKRRQFITLLGGAVAWPVAARAQPLPVIGFLRSTSAAASTHFAFAFHEGLKDGGFFDGQNVAIEYRYANDDIDRLPVLVADLLRRPAAVIIGNSPSARAAKAATTTVPIVFVSGGDPVADGLVASFNRPGGNVTGVVFFSGVLGSKRLELLRQLVGDATMIGFLANPSPETDAERKEVQEAARTMGQELVVHDVVGLRDIEAAFAAFVDRRVGAVLVGSGAFLFANRERVLALAAGHVLPASYSQREFAADGGLMSYGSDQSESYRHAGLYVARILKGDTPANLPVMRSTKLELVINLKTAKILGLTVADRLLALADEVIE